MMLRVYFLQQWFNLSDPGVEEALYDSVSMRRFAGIDLGEMPVPDESAVLRFRHLLEAHELGEKVFQQSSVRAKVEHPFLIIKRIFGFVKTRYYKGLAKNAHRLFVTCALTNLYLMRRRLWRLSCLCSMANGAKTP